jgi:DNA replication initiation complex subunit (GINS family)
MITYSEIRNMQRREKESTSIQDLGEEFLVNLGGYIEDKKKIISKNKDDSNPFSKEMEERARAEMENAIRVIDDLFQMREKKIIYQAILSAKKDVRIYNTSNMLEHEKELFESTLELIRKHRKGISQTITSLEKIKKEKEVDKTRLVRFSEDVASFLWKEKQFGPFSKDDLTNLSEDLAGLLVRRGKAVEVVENENTEEKEEILP